MNVCLIDVDSRIPNLALMKLSAWHEAQGDHVKLGYSPLFDDPDLAYVSKMFDFTPEPMYLPQCEVVKGGTGYDLSARLPIPNDGDDMMPDYDLYGCDYAMGRFTRGCPNRCPWCVVPKMDGNEVREVSKLSDWWSGQRNVCVLDDNIMADGDAFMRACEQLSKAGVHVKWEALDIRFVNKEMADALASVKLDGRLHFAWDGHGQDDAIGRGVEHLLKAGIKPWRIVFYVLIGFNTSREYDLQRVETLRDLYGIDPFVMPYDKGDRYQKDFARWCNNRKIFKTQTWAEYDCPTNRGEL